MAYSVKELSTISGVSVRTLHWYDEIGLLKPAYHKGNGARYYEEEQLLQLQQILFFRELGFQLSKIKKIINKVNFDKAKALKAHRHTLEIQGQSIKNLIKTIDHTLNHLNGEVSMSERELFEGFDLSKQKDYEEYLVNYHGTMAEDLIHESKRNTAEWDQKTWDSVKEEGNEIFSEVALLLREGYSARDKSVQEIIERHFQMINRFYTASKDVYTGLAQLYCEHPGFRKFFEKHHEELPEFFAEAMRVYSITKL